MAVVKDSPFRPVKKKPHCPIHTEAMTFDKDNNYWTCDSEGCQIVAFPKGDGMKTYVVRREGWKVAVAQDPHGKIDRVTLINAHDNVTIDVTDVAIEMRREQGSLTSLPVLEVVLRLQVM